MPNMFRVAHYRNTGWYNIDGTPIFPLRYSSKLDESLDECYISIINSNTPKFKRTDRIRVSITDNTGNTQDTQYIIANDSAVRSPVWSDTYKHELTLLEETKLIEGIICPSLTFTNVLKNIGVSSSNKIPAIDSSDKGYLEEFGINGITFPEIFGPVAKGTVISLPTTLSIKEKTAELAFKLSSRYDDYNIYPTGYKDKLMVNGNEDDGESAITIESDTTVEYVFTIRFIEGVLINSSHRDVEFHLKFEIGVTDTIYPLKKITITDVVERILRCAEPLSDGENPRYEFDPYQADKYSKVYAPEFSLTQCTLREQLQAVGAYVHAEPRIDGKYIIFEEIEEIGELEDLPYIEDSENSTINDYNTNLLSNASNMTSSNDFSTSTAMSPSGCFYKSLRTTAMYSRLEDGNAIYSTEFNIYSVVSMKCGVYNKTGDDYIIAPVDISKFVYESTEYNSRLSNFSGSYPYSKSYAVYYTIGSNEIGGMLYTAPALTAFGKYYSISNILALSSEMTAQEINNYLVDNFDKIIFQVEYIPIGDQLVIHGKDKYEPDAPPFAKFFNQGENIIESRWYGEYIKGRAAMLGNGAKTRTYVLSCLSDIPKVRQAINGNIISNVEVEVLPNAFKSTITYSERYNRLSEYIGISSVRRLYEVSEREAYNRNIFIHNTVVLGTLPSNYKLDNTCFLRTVDGYRCIFDNNLTKNSYANVVVEFSRKNSSGIKRVVLPTLKQALGNVASISFGVKDNYSAGDMLEKQTDGNVYGYWQTDVQYSDYYGKAYYARILMYPDQNYEQTFDKLRKMSYSLPSNSLSIATDNPVIDYKHILDKDNREIISYTLTIEAKTNDDNISIGSGMAKLCGYISPRSHNSIGVYIAENINCLTSKINTNDYEYIGSISVSDYGPGWFSLTYNCGSLLNIANGTYSLIIATESITSTRMVSNGSGDTEVDTIVAGGDILFTKKIVINNNANEAISNAINSISLFIMPD